MSYAALLVHARSDAAAEPTLRLAARLAKDFQAHLIGLAAAVYVPIGDGALDQYDSEISKLAEAEVRAELQGAENAFRRICGSGPPSLEWRSFSDFPRTALAREARAADLVIVGAGGPAGSLIERRVSMGDLVLSCGRPVLVGPAEVDVLQARKVLIAWKDTREARRAVTDAMPFLKRAKEVLVAHAPEYDADNAPAAVQDVCAFLERHGVGATGSNLGRGHNAAEALLGAAADFGADLIVTGGYGHPRLQEWVFGGVTQRLLRQHQRFVLFSH